MHSEQRKLQEKQMQTSFFGPPKIKSDRCEYINITFTPSFFYVILFFYEKNRHKSRYEKGISENNTPSEVDNSVWVQYFVLDFESG